MTPPIRLANGDIGCPRCSTSLKLNKSIFHIRKKSIGYFESLLCPLCSFYVFTEKGTQNAIVQANLFGFIGLPYDENSITLIESHYVSSNTDDSKNSINDYLLLENPQKDIIESYTNPKKIDNLNKRTISDNLEQLISC